MSDNTMTERKRTKGLNNLLSHKNFNILMTSVSENPLFESECFFFLQSKIYPFLKQDICVYVGHYFLKQSWAKSSDLSVSFECVKVRIVKCYYMRRGTLITCSRTVLQNSTKYTPESLHPCGNLCHSTLKHHHRCMIYCTHL